MTAEETHEVNLEDLIRAVIVAETPSGVITAEDLKATTAEDVDLIAIEAANRLLAMHAAGVSAAWPCLSELMVEGLSCHVASALVRRQGTVELRPWRDVLPEARDDYDAVRRLFERYPASRTPGEACALAGIDPASFGITFDLGSDG
jgi:hypothetical protein